MHRPSTPPRLSMRSLFRVSIVIAACCGLLAGGLVDHHVGHDPSDGIVGTEALVFDHSLHNDQPGHVEAAGSAERGHCQACLTASSLRSLASPKPAALFADLGTRKILPIRSIVARLGVFSLSLVRGPPSLVVSTPVRS